MPRRKAAAVSMEESLADQAKERAHALGFSTFSAYVVQLIRKDLQQRGMMTLEEFPPSEAPAQSPPQSKRKKA